MSRQQRPITDREIKAWLAAGAVDRGVGEGLTFVASTSAALAGKASWILRYRLNGRSKEKVLGRYPELSLKDAREQVRQDRAQIERGIDVTAAKQAEKALQLEVPTVQRLGEVWFAKYIQPRYKHPEVVARVLRKHINPVLGPVAPPDVQASCRALRPALWPSAATRSRGVRPAKSPLVDDGAHAGVIVGNQRVQVGTAPAQRVQAAQHVVTDRDVDGAKLEGVQLEGLAVVGRCEETSNARDLAGVAGFGELQQTRESLGAFAGGFAGASCERVQVVERFGCRVHFITSCGVAQPAAHRWSDWCAAAGALDSGSNPARSAHGFRPSACASPRPASTAHG